jgi:hypothetical protein
MPRADQTQQRQVERDPSRRPASFPWPVSGRMPLN